MTDLRRYYLHDVLVAAIELRDAVDSGTLSRFEFALKLNDFRFRDDEGDYWFLDARTARWYRFAQGAWQPAAADPKVLEGPVSATLHRAVSPADAGAQLEPLANSDDADDWSVPNLMERIAQVTRLDYERGRTSAAEVEDILAGQIAIDEGGRIWAVGVRSGQWYHVKDGQWQPAQGAPGLEPTAEPAALDASVLRFVFSDAERLPERVAEPWDPPAGFPESLIERDIQCPACSAKNPPGSRFCNQCAERLGCPACGTVNPPHHRFCYQCGRGLDA
jgi:hypothetical protein